MENSQDKQLVDTEYIEDILESLSNPIHKRIIRAYKGDNPVESMESELGKIVMEIIEHEDKVHRNPGIQRFQQETHYRTTR